MPWTKNHRFWGFLAAGEKGPVRPFGLAREGNLDILASAWLLSCHLGTSLTAELAAAEPLSRYCGSSLAA